MQRPADTWPDTVEVRYSLIRQIAYVVFAGLVTWGFIWASFSRDFPLDQLTAVGAAIIVGGGTILLLRQLMTSRDAVITFSPEGIRDTRVAPEFIPWAAIQMIYPQSSYGNKSLMLSLDAGTLQTLTMRRLRSPLPGLDFQGAGSEFVQISGSGLEMRFNNLRDACLAFAERHGRE